MSGDCRGTATADLTSLTPCSHEEADTRVFLHVGDAALKGHRKILIRTVDSDVVVLAIRAFALLEEMIEELWVGFGSGCHFR